MTKNSLKYGILAVIVLQTVILGAEYLNAVYPLWTGREIKLKTIPVDPRSMFRGNYARLRYEISNVDGTEINKLAPPRSGEVVYVVLKENQKGIFTLENAYRDKPTEGIFIRGRIQNANRYPKSTYRIKYGIEAFFAPKEKSIQLEKDMRSGGLALIMLAKNGKATLKKIVYN